MDSETESAWWYCPHCHEEVLSTATTLDEFRGEVIEHASKCEFECHHASCLKPASVIQPCITSDLVPWCSEHANGEK